MCSLKLDVGTLVEKVFTASAVRGGCRVAENEVSMVAFVIGAFGAGRGQVQQGYPLPFADNSRG